MIETHEKLEISDFLGLYAKGKSDQFPLGAFSDCRNITVEEGEVKTREGLNNIAQGFPPAGTSWGLHLFLTNSSALTPNDNSFFVYYDGVANIRESETNGIIVAIVMIAGASSWIQVVRAFGRFYILVVNNSLAGGSVYVWRGIGTTGRLAAGAAVAGAGLLAAVGAAGKIDRGTHIFKVVYETDTGFITSPGITNFVAFNGTAVQANLTVIPTGPAGTSKRHIISTKGIINYNGDPHNREFFFVPGGTINDNVTTILTVDFYDADLVESASPYVDQLTNLASSTGIGVYGKRFVFWSGTAGAGNVIRFSLPDEPESFDSVDSAVLLPPDEYIVAGAELRGNYYIWTRYRTYVTKDNGDSPSTWEVELVDPTQGAIRDSVSAVYDKYGNILDYLVVGNRHGLWLFNGVYVDNLADKILDKWKLNSFLNTHIKAFNQKLIAIDAAKERIFFAFSDDAGATKVLLVADYSWGFSSKGIRWYIWKFTGEPHANIESEGHRHFFTVPEFSSLGSQFYYATIATNGTFKKYILNDSAVNDDGKAFDSYVEFPLSGAGITHFAGYEANIEGNGNLIGTVYWMDKIRNATVRAVTMAFSSGRRTFRLFNVVSERMFLKFSASLVSERFSIRSLKVFYKNLWIRSS
jgi:hypothetical protein